MTRPSRRDASSLRARLGRSYSVSCESAITLISLLTFVALSFYSFHRRTAHESNREYSYYNAARVRCITVCALVPFFRERGILRSGATTQQIMFIVYIRCFMYAGQMRFFPLYAHMRARARAQCVCVLSALIGCYRIFPVN